MMSWFTFFVYFFGGLDCAHLWFLRDVWIRTQSAAVASWRNTDLATHPSVMVFCSKIHSLKVDSGIRLSHRSARLHYRLAGRHDNPMRESTISPSQWLWIWRLITGCFCFIFQTNCLPSPNKPFLQHPLKIGYSLWINFSNKNVRIMRGSRK